MPPPMPPGGIAGVVFFSGFSATIASVVTSRPATEAAFCNARRTTLVGSIMPALTMSTYSRVCASKPRLGSLASSNFPTTIEPSAPARQIVINSGEDGSVIVGKILEKDQYAFGFDAQDLEYADLVKKGIIDPTKVVRQALQGASSIAGLLITTEAMVAELPKKKEMPAMPPGGGGMDF